MTGRGLYAKQILIQRQQRTPDRQGGFIETWVNGHVRMAHVERLKYQRNEEGHQMGDNYSYLIKVDSRDLDVILSDRIIYSNKALSIIAIENKDERNRTLEIIATERTT